MPEEKGLLAMHANAGITFDLAAMRRKFSGSWPVRFRSLAGLGDARFRRPNSPGLASLWVFVDGRLKEKRENVRAADGPLKMDVKLSPSDKFLTLVSTDGGNGMMDDWVIFGDPVLDMATRETADTADKSAAGDEQEIKQEPANRNPQK